MICNTKGDVVKCLRAVPFNQLLSATKTSDVELGFFPVTDDDFLPKRFANELSKFTTASYSRELDIHLEDFPKYDVFSGWNSQEGLLYVGPLSILSQKLTGKNISKGLSEPVFFAAIQSQLLTQGINKDEANFITSTLIDYYMNNPFPMTSDNRSADDRRLEAFVNLVGNINLILPSIVHLQLHSVISERSTFAYQFSHKRISAHPLWYEGPDWLRTGADHADEIYFVFGLALLTANDTCKLVAPFLRQCGNFTEEEKVLSMKMMGHFANFAKTGNPGNDYKPFDYRKDQSYTVLKTGSLEKRTYPLNNEQRLHTALDYAILQKTSQRTNLTEMCSNVKGSYLNGLMMLTQGEASTAMMSILVVCMLVSLVLIIVLVYHIVQHVRNARRKNTKHSKSMKG